MIVAIESHQGAIDMQVTTIGLDIAKNVFQVHGIDATEKIVVRKQLRRGQVLEFFKALPPCLVGMEACATAHYWARELTTLGHQVRLMTHPGHCAGHRLRAEPGGSQHVLTPFAGGDIVMIITISSAGGHRDSNSAKAPIRFQ